MTGASIQFPNRISAVSTTADLRVTAASKDAPISRGAAVTSIPEPAKAGMASTASARSAVSSELRAPAEPAAVEGGCGQAPEFNSNTPEASGTARKAPSGRSLGRSSRNDSSRLASNSGDGLGIHEPGSMIWGGDTVATAPSGRARDRAKCPAVTGCRFSESRLSEGEHDEASEEQAKASGCERQVSFSRVGLDTHDTPINSAPEISADELIKDFGIETGSDAQNSVVAPSLRGAPAREGSSLDLPAVSSGIAGLSDCIPAIDPRIEAMIRELEGRGFFVMEMKATTLRVAASSAIHSSISIPTT